MLRYEIKDLTPPKEILQAMQRQITAERDKRARIAESEGRMQEQINLAHGAREAAINESEGNRQSEINESEGKRQADINRAQGEAEAVRLMAQATAEAITLVGKAISNPGGTEAINLKIAEQYVAAFANVAKTNNTLILPNNMADMGSLIATAMSVVKQQTKQGNSIPRF